MLVADGLAHLHVNGSLPPSRDTSMKGLLSVLNGSHERMSRERESSLEREMRDGYFLRGKR